MLYLKSRCESTLTLDYCGRREVSACLCLGHNHPQSSLPSSVLYHVGLVSESENRNLEETSCRACRTSSPYTARPPLDMPNSLRRTLSPDLAQLGPEGEPWPFPPRNPRQRQSKSLGTYMISSSDEAPEVAILYY